MPQTLNAWALPPESPEGQLPAYEWAFGDVNPPVHAWAAWRVFEIDRSRRGDAGDLDFLERILHKLLLNFTWWVNRKDAHGHNLFEGGFLGLDNIGIFDRSAELPVAGHLEQADGTAWMAMYALNLLRISLELAEQRPVYEDIASNSTHVLSYQPGESDSGMFGGNSNWRGPIWMPMNYMLVESLRRFHAYYGDDFRVECPTGSGKLLSLAEVADELSRRLSRLFVADAHGRRPSHGDHPVFQRDPHFRDHCLFYEYFHGDDGRGIGASHQTGWTGLIAVLLAEEAGSREAAARRALGTSKVPR